MAVPKLQFVLTLAFLVAVEASDPILYGHQPLYPDHINYRYEYQVKDSYHGNDYGAEEARQGHNIDGGYKVLLPDGRKQIVTYKVSDAYSGYIADVRYEGDHREIINRPILNGEAAGYASPAPYSAAPAPYLAPKSAAPYVAPAPAPYAPRPATHIPPPPPPPQVYDTYLKPVKTLYAHRGSINLVPTFNYSPNDEIAAEIASEIGEASDAVEVRLDANADNLFYGDLGGIKPTKDVKIHEVF